MTATATRPARIARDASAAQIKFINDLRAERELPALTDAVAAALKSPTASRMIDELKATPRKVTKAPSTSPLDGLPESAYAVELDGVLGFVEVVKRRSGRLFMNRLIGAPGDWRRAHLHSTTIQRAAEIIRRDPTAAAKRFGDEFEVCSKCLSPLSDALSRQLKVGPKCRAKLGIKG